MNVPPGWESLGPEAKRELLADLLRQKMDARVFPLSHGQEALWFLHQMAPESASYNVAFTARLYSPVDVAALQRAFVQVTARHEMLRVTFEAFGKEPVQRIQEQVPVRLVEIDGRAFTEAELKHALSTDYARPFDLAKGPLFRLTLVHEPDGTSVLMLVVHHIVFDGFSLRVVLNDWFALYGAEVSGKPLALAPLAARYSDFVRWQADLLKGTSGEEMWGYWQRQLSALPTVELPLDHPRPSVQTFRGATHSFRIEPSLAELLRELAQKRGTTLYVTLLAAFQVLLHRYTGQDDIVVGSPTAGRSRHEFEGLVGYFVNPVVLRGDLAGAPTFLGCVDRARAVVLDALKHADYSFPVLVKRLGPDRDPGRSPLFQVEFNLIKTDQVGFTVAESKDSASRLTMGGLEMVPLGIEQQEGQFDFGLEALDSGGSLLATFKYATDLFEPATVERMARHFRRLLEGIVASPESEISDLPLLTPEEEKELAVWNTTRRPYPAACVHELIVARARAVPGRVAVEMDGARLTYGELEERSRVLSEHLIRLGVGADVPVGIYMERSLDMLVGLLGVLRSGGAYVPLDPAYPQDRLAYMLEDSGAQVLVTQQALAGSLGGERLRVVCVDGDWGATGTGAVKAGVVGPEDIAYVIYTSGSTGKPKGVAVTHGSLVNLLESMGDEPGLGESDVLLSVTTLSFDIAGLELYLPLLKGARLVLLSREEAGDGRILQERLATTGATILQATPATWRLLLESGWTGTAGLKVLCGGEALPRDLANELAKRAAEVWNVYGPTETTIWSSLCRVREGEGAVSIGHPVANTALYVLDKALNQLPVGVPGELFIGGDGLARGYWNRPDLTAERFLPDPRSERKGARMYRTGDLVRRLPDGTIECLGRLDHQVKVRGFRIELGEIEAALRRYEGVTEAVASVQEVSGADRRLLAYLTLKPDVQPNVTALREHLRGLLPSYMVPSSFFFLDRLPLTPNGKVDRKALSHTQAATEETRSYEAPGTATEEILAGLWADVLARERIGINDNFFDLGGHSLLATQVVSRIRQAFDVQLPLTEVFAAPTVARLAAVIDGLRLGGARTTVALPLLAAPGTPPVASHAQERLWFLDRIEPGSKAYIIGGALEIRGRLDESALEKALATIVARHDTLRTTFSIVDGRPVPVVAEVGRWSLPRRDVPDSGPADPDALGRVIQEAESAFDLERGPLFRPVLYRLGEDRHVLVLSMHHIVSDGWSLGVLIRELGELYDAFSGGGEAPLPPALPLQYQDYARWQRTYLGGGEEQRQLQYWRERLSGAPASLDLPSDRPRPPVESHRGATVSFLIPSPVVGRLQTLGRREGATLFMTLLAAFQSLLSRYSGQADVVVGSPVANRNRAEIEGLIGFFANTLLLRADLGGDPTFRELLGRVRASCLQALDHQDLPFERLVEEMRPERDLSRNPLFQVMFALQNTPLRRVALRNLELVPFPIERSAAQVDLTLYAQESAEGLQATFEYATDLFERETIERMAGHLGQLLIRAGEHPDVRVSALSVLTEREEQQIGAWNATAKPYPRRCVHELVLEQARTRADRVAAECLGAPLTYGALEERSGRLADHLRTLGVGPNVVVGIYMERSLDMLVGLLGVLRSGGAYVPLDPAYPRERLEHMLDDSGARVVLTQQALRDSLPGREIVAVPVDGDWGATGTGAVKAGVVGPEDIAYVIYTSGSTGKPKGVAVTHGSLVNLLESMGDEPGLGESDVLLSVTTLSFDIAGLELYLPLLKGARLVLLSREEAGDGRILQERLATTGATILQATPATWRLLLESGWTGTAGLKVLCGGEALPRDLANELAKRAAEVWNVYGPTETTIWSSLCRVREGEGAVSIGHPVANTALYVLDKALNQLPVGVPGELFIGGDGLARGYWNRPDLTAERFLPDPRSERKGARMYRTGDLVRRLPDGTIECLGRLDHQVKVRGFRIELGEIEAALRRYEGVTEAVASVQEVSGADRRLLAYLTLKPDVQPNVTALREHLRGLLPSYMVPSSFFFLDRLPLTPNGKVDRKALSRLGTGEAASGRAQVAPRTPSEALIAEIWRDALKLETVSVRDNFFDLGGHSLLAMRVLSAIEARTGHRFHPRDIIFQTLEQLASACASAATGESPVAPPKGWRRWLGALRGIVPLAAGDPSA